MTEVYRGQQGHPTPPDRDAGPIDDLDQQPEDEIDQQVVSLTDVDWQKPEEAEAVLDDVRSELQQAD